MRLDGDFRTYLREPYPNLEKGGKGGYAAGAGEPHVRHAA